MKKCNCGGKLKATYIPHYLGGYTCWLFCNKSKYEVRGGGIWSTKKDAYKEALEKLKKEEECL